MTRTEWFDWRRRETQLQLAVCRADEFGTAEELEETYAQLCDVHDELSLPQRVWLGWYENRRNFIRVRNRRRAGVRHVVREEGWRR